MDAAVKPRHDGVKKFKIPHVSNCTLITLLCTSIHLALILVLLINDVRRYVVKIFKLTPTEKERHFTEISSEIGFEPHVIVRASTEEEAREIANSDVYQLVTQKKAPPHNTPLPKKIDFSNEKFKCVEDSSGKYPADGDCEVIVPGNLNIIEE